MQPINQITPSNDIEKSILNDIKEALEFSESYISIIKSELKDAPETFDYTMDDFNEFLYKYELS